MDAIFLACLGASIAIEVPILIAYVHFRCRSSAIAWARTAATGVLATVTSLPYLWFLVPVFVHTDLFWWIGEGMVVVIEALIIAFVLRLSTKDAWLASGVCNLASLFLGQVMLHWLE